MENPLEWFQSLPTKGKIAVGAGAAGVILFVWQPWKKKSTGSDQTAAAVDPSSFFPGYGTGVPNFTDGSSIGGGSSPSPATGTTISSVGTTTVPTVPTVPTGTTAVPTGTTTVPGIPAPTQAPDPSTAPITPQDLTHFGDSLLTSVSDLLASQTTPSTQSITPTPAAPIYTDHSAASATSAIQAINQYVAANYYKLTDAQIADLHAQKQAAAQTLGYTVDSGGDLYDQYGHQVTGAGMVTADIPGFHTASTQTVTIPTYYSKSFDQQTTAPASKAAPVTSSIGTSAPAYVPPTPGVFTLGSDGAYHGIITDAQIASLKSGGSLIPTSSGSSGSSAPHTTPTPVRSPVPSSPSVMSAVDYSNQQKAKLQAQAAAGNQQAATALRNGWY